MAKSLFEQLDGTYHEKMDILFQIYDYPSKKINQ